MPVLHHGPEPRVREGLPEVGPGRQHPEDVAEGGEAEQDQIHAPMLPADAARLGA